MDPYYQDNEIDRKIEKIMSDGETTKSEKTEKLQRIAEPIFEDEEKKWKDSLNK